MKITWRLLNKPKKKLKSEKVDASFLYSLLLLCTSMCANACWYIHVRVNFVVFSTIFRKVAFLPLPYAPGSWKAACTFGSGPQAPVFIQMRRTKHNLSVSGSKEGLKAPIAALPFPYHLCSPQAWLAAWLLVHLDIHTSLKFWQGYNI